jgi:hypothetical protein
VIGWTSEGYPPSISKYDEATQTWTLADDYLHFIDALNILRRAADFKDINSTDHLLIYGYLYDAGSITAAIQITPHNSHFLPIALDEVIASSNQTIDALVQRAARLNDN